MRQLKIGEESHNEYFDYFLPLPKILSQLVRQEFVTGFCRSPMLQIFGSLLESFAESLSVDSGADPDFGLGSDFDFDFDFESEDFLASGGVFALVFT